LDGDSDSGRDGDFSYGDQLATWAMKCLDLDHAEEPKTHDELKFESALLHINQLTGKVEVDPPTMDSASQISFNTFSVRRQISFVLDESIDEQCSSPAFRLAAAC